MLTIPVHQAPILLTQPVHLASMAARGSTNPTLSSTTSDSEGTSLGEKEKIWSEVASTEMRINLMNNLINNKVGFNDVEMFNLGLEFNMKSKSLKDGDRERDTTVIEAAMRRKRKDEIKYRREQIGKRNELRKMMKNTLGEKSNEYKRMMRHLNMTAQRTRENLKHKYDKKLKHLKEKYMDDKEKKMDVIPEELDGFRDLAIFSKEKFDSIETEVPTVVKYGEVELNEDEEAVLRMHPKMAIVSRLDPGYMELNQEIGYTKVRWQIRKEEEEETEDIWTQNQKKQRTGKEEEEEEKKRRKQQEESELEDAKGRQVYNPETGDYDERKWRVTDMQECTRIYLPKPLEVKKEAEIEMRREAHAKISRQYREKFCNERGEQESNLTAQERRGLKSLEKRRNEGEIVITMTDKSTKFCVMKREDYLALGEPHVGKDKEISREEMVKMEKVLNSHALSWCRMWGTGESHGHADRVRASKVTRSGNMAVLYLSYKDHKAEPGKTRPIATGCSSNTLALSNSVSTIVEALANAEENKREVISTEDLIYNTKEHNQEVRKMKEEYEEKRRKKLKCKINHPTDKGNEVNLPTERHNEPEEVTCREEIGEKEGQKEEEEVGAKTRDRTPTDRREAEEMAQDMVEEMLKKISEREEHVKEDCKECGPPIEMEEMSLLGLDVVALFPSMSARKTGEIVRHRMMRSRMKFSGFDWKRGAV